MAFSLLIIHFNHFHNGIRVREEKNVLQILDYIYQAMRIIRQSHTREITNSKELLDQDFEETWNSYILSFF